MCTYADSEDGRKIVPGGPAVLDLDELIDFARAIVRQEGIRSPHVGFIGYGEVRPGERVLLAVDSHYEASVINVIAKALREKGAHVDILVTDAGEDKEFDYLDEVRVVMRRRPWTEEPRRWEGLPWVEELARQQGYDLLIHGKGGPTPVTEYRYEQIPWIREEHLRQRATVFPRDVHMLINEKTWEKIWKYGRGGKVRITDPEGTDITFTLFPEYYDETRRGFTEKPLGWFGHLFGHAPPPIIEKEDATGVIAGTTSHFAKPFPQIRVYIEGGRVEQIEGGGPYGEAWRELLAETKEIQYPVFPRPGLFWLWEMAIGTNPKIRRPANVHLHSSGGFEWERRRSGIIHVGIGTRWRGPEEVWAGERGILYGHLHVHLLFPTYEIQAANGEKVKVIEHGRLTALDDPEVRALAAKYGDPDELLKEDWIPEIPGISAPGRYEDFAREPERWIYPQK